MDLQQQQQHPALSVDSTGANREAIEDMTRWCDSWLPTHLRFRTTEERFEWPIGCLHDYRSKLNERDAIYVTQVLRAASSSFHHCQMTMLCLVGCWFTDEAVGVICDFLRNSTTPLPALGLERFSQAHIRRLLESLHNNTSVKELHIVDGEGELPEAELSELLQRKTDFSAISFGAYPFSIISHVASVLRQGYPSLRKLMMRSCGIDDGGVATIIEALVEGNLYEHLEELDLSYNKITHHGLLALCELSRFSHLKKLVVSGNYTALGNRHNNRRFVRAIFPPEKESPLKELDIAYCSRSSTDYIPFIKACEEPTVKLEHLNFADFDFESSDRPICNQLVESVPKMKNLRRLTACQGFFPLLFRRKNRDASKMSFRQNTSLLEFSAKSRFGSAVPTDVPFLCSIAKRNNDLMRLQSLPQSEKPSTFKPNGSSSRSSSSSDEKKASAITRPTQGSWRLALLEKVGRNPEGAYPVYTILRSRLAPWLGAKYAFCDGDEKDNKKRKPVPPTASSATRLERQVNKKKKHASTAESMTMHGAAAVTTTTTMDGHNEGDDDNDKTSNSSTMLVNKTTLAKLDRDGLVEMIQQMTVQQASALAEKDATILTKDKAIAEHHQAAALAEKDKIMVEHHQAAALAEKDKTIAAKDKTIAEQAAMIAKLRGLCKTDDGTDVEV